MGIQWRKDNRTRRQFEQDIKESQKAEDWIISEFCNMILMEHGLFLDYDSADHQDGEIKESVNADPDYSFKGFDIEVKYQNPKRDVFHIKKHQLEAYSDTTQILFLNGLGTQKPEYTILSPSHIEEVGDLVYFDVFGCECYRLHADDFNFRDWVVKNGD